LVAQNRREKGIAVSVARQQDIRRGDEESELELPSLKSLIARCFNKTAKDLRCLWATLPGLPSEYLTL
jgi:hypothetical protein